MFGLGIAAARCGWLDPVPRRLRRGCGVAALGSIGAFVLVVVAMAAFGTDGEVIFETGFHLPALAFGVIEGPLAVAASIWLLGVAQERLDRPPGALGRAAARSAYGAFVLQGAVLLGLMVAFRPVPVPAELKALAVATLGVLISFGLSWLLVSRTVVGRVL